MLITSCNVCRTTIDGGSDDGDGGGLSPGVKAAIIVPSVLLGIALCLIGGAPTGSTVARTPSRVIVMPLLECIVCSERGLFCWV